MQWCQRLDADYGVDPWIWCFCDKYSEHKSKVERGYICLIYSFPRSQYVEEGNQGRN